MHMKQLIKEFKIGQLALLIICILSLCFVGSCSFAISNITVETQEGLTTGTFSTR